MDKYETVKRLGFGACGAVFLVKQLSTKKLFAMKKIEVDERKRTRTKEVVMKEASILSQLKHPHIVLFHESFIDPSQDFVCLILDYCDGGNLSDVIEAQNGVTLSEKQIMQWFIQIVMAVQYMHSKHILHRDLKAENVFLNKRNVVKLGDFGISKILDNTIDVAKTVVGTPSYLSPELCQDIPYNSKSDIWAVGCLLYEICALKRPFDGSSLIGLFFNIIKADYQPLPSDTPAGIKDLVSQILVKTPENRPSASAILNIPYVKSHLATFISDTESIRAIRSRKDNQLVTDDSLDAKLPLSSSNSPLTQRLHPNTNSHSPRPRRLKPLAKPNLNNPAQFSSTLTAEPLGEVRRSKAKLKSEVSPNRQHAEEEAEYSDDFDDSSADEVEEDLVDGMAGRSEEEGDEDEDQYVDDFEDSDSDEDLEEVVTLAKEVQELEVVDDFFLEEEDDDLDQTLTQAHVFRSQIGLVKAQMAGQSTDC